MAFVALIFAFLIEQARPLGRGNAVHRLIGDAADLLRGVTDAGERRHGVLGWIVLVGGLLLLLAVLEWLLDALHPLAVFGFHVLVLYLTLGFGQFSHAFTSVQLALVAGDVDGRDLPQAQQVRDGDRVSGNQRRNDPEQQQKRPMAAVRGISLFPHESLSRL